MVQCYNTVLCCEEEAVHGGTVHGVVENKLCMVALYMVLCWGKKVLKMISGQSH